MQKEEFDVVFEDQRWNGTSLCNDLLLHPSYSPFRKVEYKDRKDFSSWLFQEKIKKQKEYCGLLRKGLLRVFPYLSIDFFTSPELQYLVNGSQEICIQTIRENTIYEGYSSNHEIIQWFWEVLEEMTTSQRVLFLQFTTARTRLPLFQPIKVRFS